MTYAMMAKTTKLMPLKRHRRSQNPRVVYTLVDEAMAAVDALMRISPRAEGEFGSPATSSYDLVDPVRRSGCARLINTYGDDAIQERVFFRSRFKPIQTSRQITGRFKDLTF